MGSMNSQTVLSRFLRQWMLRASEKSYGDLNRFYGILINLARELRFDSVEFRPHFSTLSEGTVKGQGAVFRLLARSRPRDVLVTSNIFSEV